MSPEYTFWYPRIEPVGPLRVSLMDVRAADDILIEYEFDRDGWLIKNSDGVEVAFVPAFTPEQEAAMDGLV